MRLERRRTSSRKGRDLWELELGANPQPDGNVLFKVWAPHCSKVDVKILEGTGNPGIFPMEKDENGYFSVLAGPVSLDSRYFYVLDGARERPDPISRFQPQSVHGASAIIDPSEFRWTDRRWKGIPTRQLIFYEVHVGTFTPEGTFDAIIARLPYLKELGVTCLEIMPVAQFPGWRNWGYDGVGLYAVQNSYGGPEGLKRLVDACHGKGLAVCLDVVYNHLGPEGNYLREFGPYFSGRYQTPWGEAVNYDDRDSNHVRRFIAGNALYWITEYHLDALRLDAVHAIYDFSAKHILEEINDRVREQALRLGRKVAVIAESDLNDSRIVRPKSQGGYDLAAQWSDDFHHALHVLFTGEQGGYYQDFKKLEDLAKAIRDTFVYDGRYSVYRRRFHGNSAKDLPADQFVLCAQNHDQVGNRALGDRLNQKISFEEEKLTAVLLILLPYLPLIFMGQEYGETAPFQYFVDHEDEGLVQAVREGRKREFCAFGWGEIPDPKAEETFLRSKIRWDFRDNPPHRYLLALYRDLIALRKSLGIAAMGDKKHSGVEFSEEDKCLAVSLPRKGRKKIGIVVSFAEMPRACPPPFGGRKFREILHTESDLYGGSLKGWKPKQFYRTLDLKPKSAVIGEMA